MIYQVKITAEDWPKIVALVTLPGVGAPHTLAQAIGLIHQTADGGAIQLEGQGLDMTAWTGDELSAGAVWLLSVMGESDDGMIRRFSGWLMAMIVFELKCRIKESESPKPAKPSRPTGPMN